LIIDEVIILSMRDNVKKFSSKFTLLFALFSMLTLSGLGYLMFLHFVFPTLVPFHGGGESVALNSANNYSQQIPWEANFRLHLTLQTNETVEVYSNGEYLCDCTSYEFLIGPGDYILVMLKSNSSVSGRFTAWQETPLEKQALGFALILVGLVGIGVSIIALSARMHLFIPKTYSLTTSNPLSDSNQK
jgi:hypothetical protein